jgi:hypothetical protein
MAKKSKMKLVETVEEQVSPEPVETSAPPDTPPIPKPEKPSILERFKSKRSPMIAGVETLQTALPHYRISDANDWVRLHPDKENYWSAELCFVLVPIQGQKDGHLNMIDEDLAMLLLPSKRIQRFGLAYATKPYDIPFLCHIPTQNLDNPWNETNLLACEKAMGQWTQATSRKAEGIENYKIDHSTHPEAFPQPKWPSVSLEKLIEVTFANRMILDERHPGLKRLIGDKVL